MKCPNCKADSPETQRFCGECGTELGISGKTLKPGIPPPGIKDQISVTKTLEMSIGELGRGILFAGRYEIIEELGAGGMGRVYRAYDKKIEEEIALKLIRPEIAAEKRTVERFRNEIKTARKITHKNVCRTHDLGEEGKTLFITMEYVRGEDLRSLVRRTRALTIGTAVTLARQVAEGLGEAHRLGIVHRDLKPGNIMIDKEGNAKIMDFGIARSLTRGEATAEGAVIGTPQYMSPEQVDGKPADMRADIYSLGVILFEMVSGRPPFEGETSLAVAHKHKYDSVPDPRTLNPQIPPALSRIILHCLEKDRETRYQTTEQLLGDLAALEETLPASEFTPANRPSDRRKPSTSTKISVESAVKKLLIPALALIVFVAGVIVLKKFIFNGRSASLDSIAVLPFRYLSDNKDKEYWAEGMTDALIGKLAQLSGLKKVISFQSSMQYRGSAKRAPEIGRELGVNCLVEGSILQIEDRIRISVQLIEAKTDRHLWAVEYDRDTRDILALQNEVTKAIASEIKVKLTPQEQTRIAKSRPVNPTVLDSLHKMLFFPLVTRYSMEDALKIQEEKLREMTRQDPEFVEAYLYLAGVYCNMVTFSVVHPLIGLSKAKETILKAIDLDDTSGLAHAELGYIKILLDYDWAGAQAEFNLAKSLSPNDVTVLDFYCLFLMPQGRFKEAIAVKERSIELDPHNALQRLNLACTLYFSRRFDEASKEFEKFVDFMPNHSFANIHLLKAYVAKKMRREALAQAEKIMKLPKAEEDSGILATVGYTYGILGNKNEAQRYLETMLRLAPKKIVDPGLMAVVYVGLGEKNRALEWLEKAYEEHGVLDRLKVDPVWDPIRGEQRFQAILKKIGLG